jgi:hypothetical protein
MMGIFDDRFMFLTRRPFERPIPGLVRMSRAMLYLKQRLLSLIGELDARSTKTIGESGYGRVSQFVREIYSLCGMSGDQELALLIRNATRSLNSRYPRRDAITDLKALLARLESYEPQEDFIEYEGYRDKHDRLDNELVEPVNTKVTDKQLMDEHSVFVIMPFAVEFGDVWKDGIQRAAQDAGFNPIRVDMINRSTNITDDIVASIDKCRLAIVDVTNNNPNVMFELGYAIAKEKKNIIISQSADYLPFDIRNIRTIVYTNTWSGIEDLKNRIQEFLKETQPSKQSKRATK